MPTTSHLYKPSIRNTRVLILVFSILLFLIGLMFVPTIFSMLAKQVPFDKSEFYNVVENFLLFSVLSPLCLSFFNNLYPDIFTNDKGLQIVTIRKFDISWTNVVEIRPAKLFGLFRLKSLSIVITKGKLTIWHNLYGLMYARLNQPSFLISSSISNNDLLIKTISTHIKKGNRVAQPN
ncbi:MAG: hypothetical protein WBW94_03080 [Anaerolineales bacterium]